MALVPQGDEGYQFFQGNTRRTRVYRIRNDLAGAVQHLDGTLTLASSARQSGVDLDQLLALATVLHDSCLLEEVWVAQRVAKSPWRRVLNFAADYVPSDELEGAFAQLQETHVVILGVGAVGSWVAIQLAQSGFRHFTLIDDDKVEPSNLNRSLYCQPDVGKPKAEVLAARLENICHEVSAIRINRRLQEPGELIQVLVGRPQRCIVVNCADTPSVDATSSLVDFACKATGRSYVIAGGYNLHLSLIGMTVIPGRTACYQCSGLTLAEKQGDDLADLRKLLRPWRNIGNLAPLAAITASFATSEVIRLSLPAHRIQPAMTNRRGEFNFLTNEMHFVSLPPRAECGCVPGVTSHAPNDLLR